MAKKNNGEPVNTRYGPWSTAVRVAGICVLIVGLGFVGHPILLWLAD